MSEFQYHVVSSQTAAARILGARGAYCGFFGAGLSVEAGVPTADQICARIAKAQLVINGFKNDVNLDESDAQAWLIKHLAWNKPDERYAACIRLQYANPADRVDFFRSASVRVRSSFAHHGMAILLQAGVLKQTCLTTNFDKLLENAFAVQGHRECQALRTESEVRFWRPDSNRCFCVKLHGDYDTHNVLNTSEETVRIDDALKDCGSSILVHHGLLVLGLAGYEESVSSLFDDLTTKGAIAKGTLDRGLLWGVYVGPKPSQPLDSARTTEVVREAVEAGAVGPKIRKMMSRMATSRVQFAFFPVFGSGQFLMDLIEQSGDRALIGSAEPLLDHELRLRRVFSRATLSPSRIDEHIRRLAQVKIDIANASGGRLVVERAFQLRRGDRRVWIAYGDIASRSFLGHTEFNNKVRAVVSPDDTFLSVGGGVAISLAEKSGMRSTLHEVSKFAPVPQGESRVTSGGDLPVHYVIHAATIEVSEAGYPCDTRRRPPHISGRPAPGNPAGRYKSCRFRC